MTGTANEELDTTRETAEGGFEIHSMEKRWQDFWDREGIYRFDPSSKKPPFTIDNPPRYASGPLHAGHAVHYTHIDFVARYKRMRGFNVMFPLCFDVNGMPIEVKVEKEYNIKMREYDRHEFIKLCKEFANGNISEMTRQFRIFGESMDPSVYYQTDAKYYRRLTQISFIRMFGMGRIYKANHPVNWCPRCGTALAESEVEYQDNITKLNTIHFTQADDPCRKVAIATTRPELLCTCQLVAVHPDDRRYMDIVGRELVTPIFDRKVPVVADDAVQKDYGTGVVMICTIGDKEDLRWVFKYGLRLEKGIDEHGRMTELAGIYSGLELKEARKRIIKDLSASGKLIKQEDNPQNVGTCWRCHTAIEYLQVPQWFMKILDMKEEVLNAADRVEWFPEFMKVRLREWVNSLTWDWVISRQRYFATPIPVWECTKCGAPVLANEEDCYVDPTIDSPPVKKCPRCGGKLKGSEEVFDTWMDSSITPLYNSFWVRDGSQFEKLYPMSLRPQSHDIIRTWAFYSIVRGLKLADDIPWKTIMMGGFILAPDGTPMHASKGNAVDPLEYHREYGADPIRYYAATCTLGKDHPFRINDVRRGSQIVRKLYNIERLLSQAFKELRPKELIAIMEKVRSDRSLILPVDKWVLNRFSQIVDEATEAADTYQFDKSVKAVVDFMWLEVADHYLEMIKHRLREGDMGTIYTAYTIGIGIPKLLAPFLPHITEDVYQEHYRAFEGARSIHISEWPKPPTIGDAGAKIGLLAVDIVAAVRRFKSDNKIALGAPIGPVRLITKEHQRLAPSLEDIRGTIKASEVTLERSEDLTEEVTGLRPIFKELGPKYRDRMKAIVEVFNDPVKGVELAQALTIDGNISFDPGDGLGEITLGPNMAEVESKWVFQGRDVRYLPVGDVIVVLESVQPHSP
ncbi:MAG: valine--tRNA ligase [Candidatus Thermoplasmatota archaeon]|nr:valine--tRNA ligase [Candidatus Thermoplasmatota archaeon]